LVEERDLNKGLLLGILQIPRRVASTAEMQGYLIKSRTEDAFECKPKKGGKIRKSSTVWECEGKEKRAEGSGADSHHARVNTICIRD